MLPSNFKELSAKEQAALGLPEGFKLATPFPFDGMNQSDSRIGMEDKDFFYVENFTRLGNGSYRSLPDVGTSLYTAPGGKTIVSFFFYNIGNTNYVIIFLSDGTAIQVDAALGTNTTISSTPNTFYNTGISTQLPCCAQWGSQYLLIANNITANSYWVWDGTLLYTAGTLSPLITITNSGAGYSSAPTVTAFGGSGSGATFSAVVNSGSAVSIVETAPGTGYQPGDQVQLYITGGGSDSGAQLTAVLAAGAVQSVVITNPGTGYTPGTYALGISGGAGSGATGTYTVAAGGTVTSAAITAGGSGYTGAPAITFPSGGGTAAAGIATISAGAVASITVVHGGSGFTGTPTLSFLGGAGSGATATANLTAGVITSVTVNNGGSGYTSAPAVVVATTFNRAAAATLTLMPYGVSGSSIETFQSRVWLFFPNQVGANQTSGTFLLSAPNSFSNFATSAGGLIFNSTDSFLKAQYTNARQSNGYLYPFGDSSVSVISNVQTSVNANTGFATTTFNYQNTDPQLGTSWRDSVASYSRTVLFANPLGVFGLYGGSVTKVSGKIDQMFTDAVFPPAVGALTPTAAVANIYSKKIFSLLMTFKDPFTKTNVNKMLCWDEKDWFVSSQSVSLIYIGTQEVSSNIKTWGTDGNSLYQLYAQPSATLSKKMSTKLFGTQDSVIKKRAYTFMFQGQDLSAAKTGISLNVNIDTNFVDPNTGLYSYPIPVPVAFAAPPPTYPFVSTGSGDVYGMNIGATLSSTSADFVVNFIGIGYENWIAETAIEGG